MTPLPFRLRPVDKPDKVTDLTPAELALWVPVRTPGQAARWMQDRAWAGQYGAVIVGDTHAALLSHARHGLEASRQWLAPLHTLSVGIPEACPQHVLWQVRSGTLSQVQAQVVVVWLGTFSLTPYVRPSVLAQAIWGVAQEVATTVGARDLLALVPPCLPRYSPEGRRQHTALVDALHGLMPVVAGSGVPPDPEAYMDGRVLSPAGYARCVPALYQALRARCPEHRTKVFRGQTGWAVADALAAGHQWWLRKVQQ